MSIPGGGGSHGGENVQDETFEHARRAMVLEQIAARGIADPRVLGAMAAVPRHAFVDPSLQDVAYEDRPLPIGFEQTISQPFMVARATELAQPRPGDRALEVGTGCGYQLAVLAELCQLADGGRMVIPIGPPNEQELALIRRKGDRYETSYDTRCRYVDLQGRFGFGSSPPEA